MKSRGRRHTTSRCSITSVTPTKRSEATHDITNHSKRTDPTYPETPHNLDRAYQMAGSDTIRFDVACMHVTVNFTLCTSLAWDNETQREDTTQPTDTSSTRSLTPTPFPVVRISCCHANPTFPVIRVSVPGAKRVGSCTSSSAVAVPPIWITKIAIAFCIVVLAT